MHLCNVETENVASFLHADDILFDTMKYNPPTLPPHHSPAIPGSFWSRWAESQRSISRIVNEVDGRRWEWQEIHLFIQIGCS